MFDNLTDRLSRSLRNISGRGRLTEDNIKDTLREVRMALLEADVALPVVKDFVNKVGVLITMAGEQPHTTVLAFLSSVDDDIFLITFPETFKSKLLKRNRHCLFAMDERAHYTFEQAIDWNYTIVEGEAFLVEPGSPLFATIREAFITKNPWEMGFFLREDIEMYHIKRKQLICSGSRAGKR